jgi:hypothetical protein
MIVVRLLLVLVLVLSTGRRRVSVLRVRAATGGDGRGPGAEWSRTPAGFCEQDVHMHKLGIQIRLIVANLTHPLTQLARIKVLRDVRQVDKALTVFCDDFVLEFHNLLMRLVIYLIESIDRITLFYSIFRSPFGFVFYATRKHGI